MQHLSNPVAPRLAAALACVAISFAWLSGVADIARPEATEAAALAASAFPASDADDTAPAVIAMATLPR